MQLRRVMFSSFNETLLYQRTDNRPKSDSVIVEDLNRRVLPHSKVEQFFQLKNSRTLYIKRSHYKRGNTV